ncbi:MAG: hypothetical protein AB4050_10710 [Synechococcus sp.]
MTYEATVVRVFIASPGDINDEKDIVRELIDEWNSVHSMSSKIILQPVTWDRDSSPEMGDRAQAIINRQLVTGCDLLIAIFWTRLGTPTGIQPSGTVEEIAEFMSKGRPVLTYFSMQPIAPNDMETEQYIRLEKFKKDLHTKGLCEQYLSLAEFQNKLRKHLTKTVRKFFIELKSDLSRPLIDGAHSKIIDIEMSTADTESSSIGVPESYIQSFEKTFQSDSELPSELEERMRSQIIEIKRRWLSEKKNPSFDNLISAKEILDKLSISLASFRENAAKSDLLLDKLRNFNEVNSSVESLKRHRIYMDGGHSYRKFWNKGDTIFSTLESMFV